MVFLTGRDEIEQMASALLSEAKDGDLLPLPLYAGIPMEAQMTIFDPAPRGVRKCILSTNIAEASLTIDGIVHVVDAGFVKIKAFDPANGMERLVATAISQASAVQRAGRAGRVRDGKCYRLYTYDAFQQMRAQDIPEIQRSDVSLMILQLKALGIDNVVQFDFVSPPPSKIMMRALDVHLSFSNMTCLLTKRKNKKVLYSLGALDEYARLTIPLGMRMAELPLEPMVARALLAAAEHDCINEMLTIAAMSSVQNVFFGGGHDNSKDPCQSRFAVEEGDHLTYLNIYAAYLAHASQPSWFAKHGLHHKNLVQAAAVRRQLERYLRKFQLSSTSLSRIKEDRKEMSKTLRQCLTRGYFANAAVSVGDGSFRSVRDAKTVLYIHPNSVLFSRAPACVLYNDIVSTTKHFMQHVTAIDIEWLAELAPHYYEQAAKRSRS